jgi:hypothetical protein
VFAYRTDASVQLRALTIQHWVINAQLVANLGRKQTRWQNVGGVLSFLQVGEVRAFELATSILYARRGG